MSSLTETQQSNAKLGLKLFVVYLVLYLVFVFVSAFAASTMERTVVAGLNLAIVYGFALIIGALVMALLYGAMCRSEPIVAADSSATADGVSAGDEQNTEETANDEGDAV